MKTRKHTSLISLFAVILAGTTGCASADIDNDTTSAVEQNVVYGWKASYTDYPSVVALTNVFKSPFCTGTLVMPDAVITAAHCVYGNDPDMFYVAIKTNDPAGAALDTFHKPYIAVTHPEYKPTDKGCDASGKCTIADDNAWNDVALVILRDPIDGAICAPILLPEDHESVMPVGNNVRIVGYGQNWVTESGILYAGDVPIVRRSKFEVEVGLNTKGATGACFGDSGGPIYVKHNDYAYVAGITSRSADGPVCGNGSIYSLPGSYMNWFAPSYLWLTCARDSESPDGTTCDPTVAENAVLPECRWHKDVPPAQPNAKPADGGSSGVGGSSPGGGAAGEAGSSTGGAAQVTPEGGGCGCSTPADGKSPTGVGAIMLAFLGLLLRRRQ